MYNVVRTIAGWRPFPPGMERPLAASCCGQGAFGFFRLSGEGVFRRTYCFRRL